MKGPVFDNRARMDSQQGSGTNSDNAALVDLTKEVDRIMVRDFALTVQRLLTVHEISYRFTVE